MIWAALDKGTENLRAQVLLLLNLELHLWAREPLPKDKENVFILPWADTATGSLCVLCRMCHAVLELCTWYTFTFLGVAGELRPRGNSGLPQLVKTQKLTYNWWVNDTC